MNIDELNPGSWIDGFGAPSGLYGRFTVNGETFRYLCIGFGVLSCGDSLRIEPLLSDGHGCVNFASAFGAVTLEWGDGTPIAD